MITLNDSGLLRTKAFISGEWTDGHEGKTFDVINPATGKKISSVVDSGVEDVNQAIRSAKLAMDEWRSVPAKQKSNLLRKWVGLIFEHQEDLATIMTIEQGKPLAEARSEILSGAATIEWFAEEAKRVYGDVIPSPVGGRRTLVIKQAVGIVAAITPWNFPMSMIARKVGPAIAAGCAIILKPSEETPLSALALAELASRAGLPKGLFSVLPSFRAAKIGEAMTSSSEIKKITFTGSSRVGKIILRQCADTVKRTSMELGGNAPFIVFNDADLSSAVEGVIASKFRNAGQTCVCANRILVQNEIYDEFSRRLSLQISKLKVGSGMQDGIGIGPLINRKSAENAISLIADAKTKGGEIIGSNVETLKNALYIHPTIILNASREMRVYDEEIFAPIAPLFRFSDEAEAIELANDTPFGLAAYTYTSDLGRAWRVSEALDCGMVGINEGVISTEVAPFGGWKESGHGREGSKYGMDEYLEIKYVCMGGLNT